MRLSAGRKQESFLNDCTEGRGIFPNTPIYQSFQRICTSPWMSLRKFSSLREGCGLKKVEGWNEKLQDAETDHQILPCMWWGVSQPSLPDEEREILPQKIRWMPHEEWHLKLTACLPVYSHICTCTHKHTQIYLLPHTQIYTHKIIHMYLSYYWF